MTSRINPDDTIRDYESRHDIVSSLVAEDRAMHKAIDKDPKAFMSFNKDERVSYFTAMKEQRFASQLVGKWLLPGHGSNGKDSCANYIPKGHLDVSDHPSGNIYSGMFCSSCGSVGCNKCFEPSIQKQAYKTSIRLTGVALMLATKEVHHEYNSQNKLNHIAISVPVDLRDELLTDEGLKKHENKLHSLLKVLGLQAGSIVFHPYRFTDKLESIKDFSPHWHILAVGWLDGKQVAKIEAGEKKKNADGNGYEYNYEKFKDYFIKSMSLVDTKKKIYNVVSYQLSHAGIEQKEAGKRSSKQIVKYFGKANPRHGKYASVLSNSESAYDQINKLLQDRESKMVKESRYTLSHVSLSVVTYDTDIKKAQRKYAYFDDGKISSLYNVLSSHVTPQLNLKDNPDYDLMCDFMAEPERRGNSALTECVPLDKFICIRLDYLKGNDRSYMVSDYLTVFFDPSLSLLCPECSCKIRPLKMNVNHIDYQDNFCKETLPMMVEQVGKLFPSDTTMGFEYLTHQNMSPLGMQYFSKDEMLYSNGRDTKPECFDKLNPLLQNRIDGCIDWQFNASNRKEAKRQEWINNNSVYLGRGIAKPVVTQSTIKRTTNSYKLSDY